MNKSINIKMKQETLDKLQAIADEKEEGNLSLLIRKIIKEYLDK